MNFNTFNIIIEPESEAQHQIVGIMEIRKPKVFLIKLAIKGKSGNILRDLENFPDMPMDIIYQVVARSDYYYAKTRITLTSEDLRTALYQYTSGVRK